jgi:hypothetical protein
MIVEIIPDADMGGWREAVEYLPGLDLLQPL